MERAVQRLVIVFFVGTIGIWKSVPAGFLLKVPPVLIFIMTVLGASAGVSTIYVFGKWITSYIKKKKDSKRIGQNKAGQGIFSKSTA